MIRTAVVVVLLVACSTKPDPHRQLAFDLIKVTSDAKMRTDTVGDGRFAETATFVLVDAENTANEGAYVTLTGTLSDEKNIVVGQLKQQSLWIPAHESRTYALVDLERKARPTAVGARVEVKGAAITGFEPSAKLSGIKTLDDVDKIILQGVVENPADREGRIIVIGAFHNADGTPMTRPFDELVLQPKEKRAVQFVGPVGSKRGQIYIGDEAY